MRVFVTGASGLIGRPLCDRLVSGGHAVTALSRSGAVAGLPAAVRVLQGDPAAPGTWQEALAACDACVHLAGEPVAAHRWTPERKRVIRESRVASTRLVAETIARGGPTVLVSGSAIGFYGARGDERLDESAPSGEGFLAEVCRAWEDATAAASARARVVLLRTGVVLAPRGGALEQMVLPFRFFAGGPIGSGAFWQSWIHLQDEIGLVAWALENAAVVGPLNATAPEPVRNRDLAAAIGRVLHRPSALPVPTLGVKLLMGELASVAITGQRVIPRKAVELGYRFQFPDVEGALQDLLGS